MLVFQSGIKQAICEISTKFIFHLKGHSISLCMEYDIVRMAAANALGGVHPGCQILNRAEFERWRCVCRLRGQRLFAACWHRPVT